MDESQAIKLLRKYAPNETVFKIVLAHSKAVQKIALRIAKKIKSIDIDFIKTASLLHDIGRFKCPPDSRDNYRHGIAGAEILRKENLPKHALVAERHLGVGIKKQDIKEQKLDMPLKDFVPLTKEEKIITYADKLVFGDKEGTLQMVIERYRKELGKKYVERIKKFAKEIESWKK